MKVALVLCPAWSREMPHLAIAMLSANLRKDGHQVLAFDLNNDFYHHCVGEHKGKWKKEEDSFWSDPAFISKFISANEEIINQAVKRILASDAQIIGFSVYHPTELMSLELAKRIKGLDKDRIIIFGGVQCARESRGKILIKEEVIDVVVAGEGELTLSELTRMIERDKKIDFCEGILFKKNGEVIDCGNRAAITDLDSLPFSDFTDFSLSLYEHPRYLPFLSSRGCIQRCVFCTVGSFWKKYRSMSGERMFQEIEQQLKLFKDVDFFNFNDPLLNGNIEELSRFCDLLIENTKVGNLPAIQWGGEAIIRPEVTREILEKMRKAGCCYLAYGIESGSQRVLDKMRKYFKIADAQRIIRQTHEVGIKVTLNFIFGFPTEKADDFQETLKFLKRNAKYIAIVLPSATFCSIDGNSYLFNHSQEFNILPDPHHLFWESMDGENTYPERLRRFEVFCELASSLNIHLGTDYNKIKLFKDSYLKEYYIFKRESDLLHKDTKEEIFVSKKDEPQQVHFDRAISFSWNLHYKCNYRCPYCFFFEQWNSLSSFNKYIPYQEWLNAWDSIYEKYGDIRIEVSGSGGEPLIYPHFTDIISNLSYKFKIDIATNLSCNLNFLSNFVKKINCNNVYLSPTFHPSFEKIDLFINKLRVMKNSGFPERKVLFVGYPPQLGQALYLKAKIEGEGYRFVVIPFRGEYRGVEYPDNYTQEEKDTINKATENLDQECKEWVDNQLVIKNPKNKLCVAGYKHAHVEIDGIVHRCINYRHENKNMGSIFEKNFSLLDKPYPCSQEKCPCEYYWLVE